MPDLATPTTHTSLSFTGDWSLPVVIVIGLVLGALILLLYRRERGASWLPAMLRAITVFLCVLALSGPVLRHETTTRQLGRVVIAVDASQSMKLIDDATAPSRWDRMQQAMFKDESKLLKALSDRSDVELVALRGARAQRLWWHRQAGNDVSGPVPNELAVQPDAPVSDLDGALRQALGPATAGSAVVLLSDGQHNAEGSPEDLASTLKQSAVPVFSVGFGAEIPPADLAVVDVTAPEAVFSAERVQGIVTLRDSMPAGMPATVRLESAGKVLFEESFQTDGKGERQLAYAFLMKDMPNAQAAQADKNLRRFTAVVGVLGEGASKEKTRSNNTREVTLHLLAKKRKLLVLDGRARWETRYLQTHFERDERWEVTSGYDDYAPGDNNAVQKAFPKTKDDLFAMDLIVLGDLAPDRLKAEHVTWLAEFVEQRGGGVIMIDGAHRHLSQWAKGETSARLLPVSWISGASADGPLSWHLTPDAERITALRLSDSSSANATLWPTLPPAMSCAQVKAATGAITLASLKHEGKELPALVFRTTGAGAVLYVSSDDLWRWRYQVADQIHQRLWMQIGAWIAAPPFQAEATKLAIGTDRLRYDANESAELRVRLRSSNGSFITDAKPRAYLISDGEDRATLELEPDPTHAGVYRALTPPLRAGAWQIAVSESATAARDPLRLTLRVADTGNQELSTLTMNRPLLESMARSTGGRFLREDQLSELPDLLSAIDRKETNVRETVLWSSWWWLGTIIALLTAEWIIRRKQRLV
jgi:uncharacterized membrane protein